MHLRTPIAAPKSGRLRVLIYARYSTEEQDASSITDQFGYCRRFLGSHGITDAIVNELQDAELSGELVQRPGIDQVAAGIAAGQWNLIIAEDSSRLFRTVAPALILVGNAVDNGMRVLCLNDDVDTTEETWSERLTDALSHHARTNRFTSQRIKRKHEGLWHMGAALGPVKSGYRRRPSIPASMGQPARGPFFDEIDPQWQGIIEESYQRIADGDPPWLVAQWLTATGLPKSGNARDTKWTAKIVIALIRRPDYRGEQVYRNMVVQKEHRTGKHKLVPNNDEQARLRRSAPQLRMVPDVLWYAANDAIDKRAPPETDAKRGQIRARRGVPRDSQGPLSQNFFCGICGAKMYQDGRGSGGYRCSGVRSETHSCWNKATADRNLVHRAIGKAIADKLIGAKEQLAVMVELVADHLQSDDSLDELLVKAHNDERRLERSMANLTSAVESLTDDGDEALVRLTGSLKERGGELRRCRLEIERLEALKRDRGQTAYSNAQIEAAIAQSASRLLELDGESCVLVPQLAPRILAVPYQQFGGNKVVLRAKFELHVARFLPQQLRDLIDSDSVATEKVEQLTVPIVVDLFEMSNSPKYGLQAYDLKLKGVILEDIGKALGISKRSAHLAAHFGQTMHEAGVTDPYIELVQAPAQASRWRQRGHRRKAG